MSRRTSPYVSFIGVSLGIAMMKRSAEIGLGATRSGDSELAGIDTSGEAILCAQTA